MKYCMFKGYFCLFETTLLLLYFSLSFIADNVVAKLFIILTKICKVFTIN